MSTITTLHNETMINLGVVSKITEENKPFIAIIEAKDILSKSLSGINYVNGEYNNFYLMDLPISRFAGKPIEAKSYKIDKNRIFSVNKSIPELATYNNNSIYEVIDGINKVLYGEFASYPNKTIFDDMLFIYSIIETRTSPFEGYVNNYVEYTVRGVHINDFKTIEKA
jgi:hypothetical protein